MIHFFPIFSKNAENTEFGHALKRIGINHKIFSGHIRFNYRSRLKLVFVCIPRLMLFAGRSAIASLVLSRPVPDAVVLGSDIEVLVFALVRALFRRKSIRLVLGSFIFTSRSSKWQNRLRKAYYQFVLSQVDVAIVHSRLEVDRYARLLAGGPTKFRFVPWGTSLDLRTKLLGNARFAPGLGNQIVTAGKSGRDYVTLFQAMTGVPSELRVICDYLTVQPDRHSSARITHLSNCYGEDYLRELINASLVIVPLAVGDISAGQMVLIQAMGLGKAILVTDTPTIRDYVTDRQNAWVVPRSDVSAMHTAIVQLLEDATERERLGRNAMDTFDTKFSTEGHFRGLINAIQQPD
jgi:glycosyltransferase involved in cell wall biosynthesis